MAAPASPALAQAPATEATLRDPAAIRAAAVRMADWQLARLDAAHIGAATSETRNPRAWEQGVFWVGMTALAEMDGAPPHIAEAIMAMGGRNDWQPGERPFFADDHVITQAYLWAAENGAGAAARAPTQRAFDHVLDNPPVSTLAFVVPPEGYGATECLVRWCWCDALFMAPPAFAELTRQTGDARYRDYATAEWWATTDFLYDPVEHLFYRDSRFSDRRDGKGRKQFWSRGNGWVFAGMARMIPLLPEGSADRTRMEALFKKMAARLRDLQKTDGYWAPSLLAPEDSPPESSGTGFYTYGMAWGIKAGLLDAAEYRPVVDRGWAALTSAIQPDGSLGWVQQVSDRPDKVAASDTQYYGVGAFLLAARAVAELP
ncbi:glycoside hydrolase family 88 protein [Croceibacterium sp. TMG7-5b_MA50]|uniref:glycoside hydrolase family 88/105 protein n=1 Tax=Croceibacterium sp. TMG7-5b_MA50 TaxID=3121290 RepID=UPI0032221ACC